HPRPRHRRIVRRQEALNSLPPPPPPSPACGGGGNARSCNGKPSPASGGGKGGGSADAFCRRAKLGRCRYPSPGELQAKAAAMPSDRIHLSVDEARALGQRALRGIGYDGEEARI